MKCFVKKNIFNTSFQNEVCHTPVKNKVVKLQNQRFLLGQYF